MSKWLSPLLFGLALAFAGNRVQAQSNDQLFPAAASAKSFVDFDKRGFIIKGQRTFLVSAGLEYARIPHELWRDRLLRLKRAGFNCIEIYTFWNFHEPQEGKFDFTGDHDLNAFLRLVKQLDMYAIVRVGPYYCAEWDLGGYPIWLRFKDGLKVREPNAVFETAVDHFFEQLIPIVSANQVTRGGSVILVQLENEHPLGWGTYKPNEYFTHLQNKAVSLGIEVPYFFSGLHHGSDPAGDAMIDNGKRTGPWLSTEFWSVWYNYYGSSQKDADTYARRTWKIIARGGNGYNYYMAHGGTNFGYTNNNEDAASYDYGAAVGQTGDLRPVYYEFKRAAYFARSFQHILANSDDASEAFAHIARSPVIKVTARHSATSDLVFLDNQQDTAVPTQIVINKQPLPQHGPLVLAPGEIVPLVHNITLTPSVKLDWAIGRVLGLCQQQQTTTIVVYGKAGSDAELQFTVLGKADPVTGIDAFNQVANNLIVQIAFHKDRPVPYSFETGKQMIRVLAVTDSLAARTWFAGMQGKQHIVIGPAYVGDVTLDGSGKTSIAAEQFWNNNQPSPVWLYGADNRALQFTLKPLTDKHQPQLPLTGWQVKDAGMYAAPGYDDHSWKQSSTALQMGADGDNTADAWYRTSMDVKEAGIYTLQPHNGGDRATVFVDGSRVATGDIHNDVLTMQLSAGTHTLAVFTAHDGRDKLFNHLGAIADTDPKGLSGEVLLHQGNISNITAWKWQALSGTPDISQGPPTMDKAADYTIGADVFNGQTGYAVFQAMVPAQEGTATLHFKGVDDNAVVFINGKMITRHTGYSSSFDVPLQTSDAATVTLLVENTGGAGGISKPVQLMAQSKGDVALTNWRMQGGPGDGQDTKGYQALPAAASFEKPMFFRSTFTIDSIYTTVQPIWRITLNGLGHGSIWVNGRNLGRYPEKIPVNSLYIPECWLHKGANTVVVYDEDGHTPANIRVEAELPSSRDIQQLLF